MFELTEREQEILEDQGWRLLEVGEQDGCPYVEIENWSPAGEDLPETIWIEEGDTFASAARKWADSFDKDDHVELWVESRGERGVPSSIRELVDDADEIQQMFNELADALEGIEDEAEDGKIREYRIPLVWQMYGHVWVEAKSKKEAIEYALGPECPLPEGSYMDDSVTIDDGIEIEVNEL